MFDFAHAQPGRLLTVLEPERGLFFTFIVWFCTCKSKACLVVTAASSSTLFAKIHAISRETSVKIVLNSGNVVINWVMKEVTCFQP